jgi:hydroxymethylpyrimidine pyrophosphatase-like HAD family hydrolase
MRKTIAFDFDGVIHKYSKGWQDGSIYDTIDFELLSFMKELLKKYNVVIYSTRDPEQITNYLNELGVMKFETFNSTFWNKKNVVGVTNTKPAAVLYIDDRAFEYIPGFSTDLNIAMIKTRLEVGEMK